MDPHLSTGFHAPQWMNPDKFGALKIWYRYSWSPEHDTYWLCWFPSFLAPWAGQDFYLFSEISQHLRVDWLTFCSGFHAPQRMNLNDFGALKICYRLWWFPSFLVPQAGQDFQLFSETSQHRFVDWLKLLYRLSWSTEDDTYWLWWFPSFLSPPAGQDLHLFSEMS